MGVALLVVLVAGERVLFLVSKNEVYLNEGFLPPLHILMAEDQQVNVTVNVFNLFILPRFFKCEI